MPKYCRLDPGSHIYFSGSPERAGLEPVLVISTDQWRELLDNIRACGGRGGVIVDRVWDVIQRVEAENNG